MQCLLYVVVCSIIHNTTTTGIFVAITKDQIWKIADQLDADGVKPTLSAVRKKLGSGSYTTI
ncbi:DNA-binding protein, partial [Xanthomonas perforans]|uniref:DNA-binding protein n=1 Tax=Xanthomonas perforans TaxID=442694 RepID=UPI003CCF0C4F